MNESVENIVLFDGVCNLCNSLVRFIIKRDKKARFKFASLQSETGRKKLEQFGLAGNEFDSFVLIREDQYYLKSTGILKMLKELGGIWKVFYVFIFIPPPLRDLLYSAVAKSRYKLFGRKDVCMLPTPALKERFI